MSKNKGIQILRSFRKKEKNAFSDFLRSPYHNKSAELFTLGSTILRLIETNEDVSDDVILNTYNHDNNKQITRAHYNVLLHSLSQKIDSFLIAEHLKNDPTLSDQLLLRQLLDRALTGTFEKRYEKAIRRAQTRPAQIEFVHDIYYLKQLKTEFNRRIVVVNRTEFLSEEGEREYFEAYTYLQKLTQVIRKIGEQREYQKTEINHQDEAIVKKTMASGTFSNDLLITMYHQCYLMFTEIEDREHFELMKNMIFQFKRQVSKREMHWLLTFVLGHCYYMNVSGKLDGFRQEAYELTKFLVEEKILDYKTNVDDLAFRNVVLTFTNAKDFERARKFVKDYSHRIDSSIRDNMVSYNLGVIAYQEGNDQKALKYFNALNKRLPMFYEITFRMGIIAIYYNLKEWEVLAAALKSFQNYVYRNREISEEYRTYYLNFTRYAKHLLKASSAVKLKKLITEVEARNDINNKRWIITRAQEKLAAI